MWLPNLLLDPVERHRRLLASAGEYSRSVPSIFDGESDPEEIESAVSSKVATVDPRVSPFRLRNRYRSGVGTWIVSLAVPEGHSYQPQLLKRAAESLGMRVEGFFEYSGDLEDAIRADLGEPPTQDGLPLTNEDQTCSFCDDGAPTWVHPLDESKTKFETVRGNSTLPSFWTVCQRCEQLIDGGQDDELARLFQENEADSMREAIRVVQVFRVADLGSQPIAHVPVPD